MKIGFAMMPYEGETLYSWAFRYTKYSICKNENQAVNELFGDKRYARRIRYMSKIGHLSKVMQGIEGFTIEEILDNLTYLNISRSFFCEERYMKMRYGLLETSSALKRNLGFHLNGLFLSDENVIKTCPLCFVEDQKIYGEAYIHRHHNVVGVKTCYKHNCYLDSIDNRYYTYTPFLDINVQYIPKGVKYPDLDVAQQHKKLNLDISYILNGNLKNITPKIIEEKVMSKLNFLGVHIEHKSVKHPVLKGFLDDLGLDFLKEYESDYALNEKGIWLRSFLYDGAHSKKAVEINPLRKILAIGYLFGSLEKFNEYDQVFEIFGSGPYPCNNPVCKYYHKKVIESYIVSKGRPFTGIKGIFTCEYCGFSYLKNDNPSKLNNPYEYTVVKKYGEVWEKKLEELVTCRKYTVSEIAKVLKVQFNTVVMHSHKLGFGYLIKSTSNLRLVETDKDETKKNKILQYKKRLIEYIKLNPNKIRTEIYKSNKVAYRYLSNHEREWLESNLPRLQYGRNRNSLGYNENQWREKENLYIEMVNELVIEINESSEAVKITKTLLAKRMRYSGILKSKNISKMPNLKKQIEEVVETHNQYLERINKTN